MPEQSTSEKLYLRIELSLLLDEVLGDRHYMCISERLAVGLVKLTNNSPSHGCYVQFKDELSPDLKFPILWRYHAWVEDSARRERNRRRAQAEQDARWVFDANVANIKRGILKKFSITDTQASMIATKLMRDNNLEGAKFFGVTRIITDVKDI